MPKVKAYLQQLPRFRPPGQARPVALMGANENALGPSPKAVEALRAAAGGLHRYPSPGGEALKPALARHLGVPEDWLFLGNGSEELILILALTFLEPGDRAVISEGSFISYGWRIAEVGAQAVRVPLRETYWLDGPALAAAAREHRAPLLFLCTPNNPTGARMDPEEVEAVVRSVPPDTLVVIDEAYREFIPEPFRDGVELLKAGYENVVVLRTFSKLYGLAGVRIGYGIAAPAVVDLVERVRPVFNVTAPAQAAARAALEDAEHVRRTLEHVAASRELFREGLARLGLRHGPLEWTNFVCVDVGRSGRQVAAALLEAGYAVSAVDGWGVPNHIRVTFGTEEENRGFLEALGRVVRGG